MLKQFLQRLVWVAFQMFFFAAEDHFLQIRTKCFDLFFVRTYFELFWERFQTFFELFSNTFFEFQFGPAKGTCEGQIEEKNRKKYFWHFFFNRLHQILFFNRVITFICDGILNFELSVPRNKWFIFWLIFNLKFEIIMFSCLLYFICSFARPYLINYWNVSHPNKDKSLKSFI